MPHIKLKEGLPGIRGLMDFSPETAKPLNQLAEILLRSEQGLSSGEREIIATYVSQLNECRFCTSIHGAVAQCHFPNIPKLSNQIKFGLDKDSFRLEFLALLDIAKAVVASGKAVQKSQIDHAKMLGATDLQIHDTVLIAAAFCMFNRYVDGLNTDCPSDPDMFHSRAQKIIHETGYAHSSPH